MGGLICLKNIENFLKRTSKRYSMLKITRDGEKLCATSSISFEKHLKAFKEGKRN